MNETYALLVLYRLRVQNANAVSGPLSWGFPSPTAFTGFAHALQRRLKIELGGIGIVCHRFDPQIDQPEGPWRRGQFCLARHPYVAAEKKPVKSKSGNFKASAIVEEGRAHMDVSLVIELKEDLDDDDLEDLRDSLETQLLGMRLAGGTLLDAGKRIETVEWSPYVEGQLETFRKLRYRLLPGFSLVERRDLLEHATQARTDVVDAFLDMLALTWEPQSEEESGVTEWRIRSRPGWIVPLAVGYAGLSALYPPGVVRNTRDPSCPFRFVESLYTLGQWLGPHRLDRLEQLLWHAAEPSDDALYLCHNHYSETKKEVQP